MELLKIRSRNGLMEDPTAPPKSPGDISTGRERKLSEAEKARIERNRIKALSLRSAKLVTRSTTCTESIIKVAGTRYKDTGGGFLLEENAVSSEISKSHSDAPPAKIIHTEATHPIQTHDCKDCGEEFLDSYLHTNFGYLVCDKCREPEEKHSLITKTEAKAQYLLQDCDLDKRQPPLKFIMKKNPHNERWGDMKLYLHIQVEERALQVWGSEDNLRQQHEQREEKREVGKVKKYNKKMKELRMDMRSSLYDRTTKVNHKHEYGPDVYNEADDNYTHTCLSCPYAETFEKM